MQGIIKISIISAVFLIASTGFSQQTTRNIPKEKSEAFLNLLLVGQVDNAYDQIFQGSTALTDKPQDIAALKKETTTGINLYGKVLGFDFVTQKIYGTSVVREIYLLKTEKLPLVWNFYYYRVSTDWVLVSIYFSDNTKELNGI